MSPDIAEQNLINVNELIESAKDFDLCSPIEFKNKLLESTTPETKALVTQVRMLYLYHYMDIYSAVCFLMNVLSTC